MVPSGKINLIVLNQERFRESVGQTEIVILFLSSFVFVVEVFKLVFVPIVSVL